MQVNLRKARQLEQKLKTFIDAGMGSIQTEAFVTYGVSTDVANEKIDKQREQFTDVVEELLLAVGYRFGLRSDIASYNMTSGITKKITQIEKLKREMEIWARMTGHAPQMDLAELRAALDSKDQSMYGRNRLNLPTMTEDEIRAAKDKVSTLKLGVEKIQDEINGINVSQAIGLSEELVAFLKKHKLLG